MTDARRPSGLLAFAFYLGMKFAYALLALGACSHDEVLRGVVVDREHTDSWLMPQRVGEQTIYTEMPPTYSLRVTIGEAAPRDISVDEAVWTDARAGRIVEVHRRYVGCLSSETVVLSP